MKFKTLTFGSYLDLLCLNVKGYCYTIVALKAIFVQGVNSTLINQVAINEDNMYHILDR